MADEYGVTDHGFVMKRMDTILGEIHAKQSADFGFDTTRDEKSFLNFLNTSFAGAISDLWEKAADIYYSRYVATASGVNLDNAMQGSGVKRVGNRKTSYPLHCTGEDGTFVHEGAIVSTNTLPVVQLTNPDEFEIARNKCNGLVIVLAALEKSIYSVTINGSEYKYTNTSDSEETVLEGLASAIKSEDYDVEVKEESLCITDKRTSGVNEVILSENLTTSSVTVIANFQTTDYGKIIIPDGTITNIVNNITGFDAVTNLLTPIYGRLQETDTELRHAHLHKSALRANYMVEGVSAYLVNNIANVVSATGYENDTDYVDELGLMPHSIELVVDGGDDMEVARAILKKKAGGIQTNGNVVVDVPDIYGKMIPIRFNRPERVYVWMRVTLHGHAGRMALNYEELAKNSVTDYSAGLIAGDSLLIQRMTDGLYNTIPGLTYIDIYTAFSTDSGYRPGDNEYRTRNVILTPRQKIDVSATRIEVTFLAD